MRNLLRIYILQILLNLPVNVKDEVSSIPISDFNIKNSKCERHLGVKFD